MARGRKGLGVEPLKGSIRLKFTLHSGERVSETLAWEPTPANIKRATRLAADVRRDIEAGALDDQRYLHYFPDSKRVRKIDVGDGTLRHYAKLYLESLGGRAKNTQASYGSAVRFWLKHLGAESKIANILHSQLKAFWGRHPWKSWKQANNYLIALRGIFALARGDGVLRLDPLEGIENKEKPPRDDPDPFTEAEQAAILEKIAERYGEQVYNYFDFAFATGMRPEEIIELRWSDIDQNAGIARVTRARSLGEVRHPKNGKFRDVELNSAARAALARQAKHSRLADGYIFLNPETGNEWNSTASQRDHYWNPTLKALGVRHRVPYNTRHTRATRLLTAGCKPAWCAAQLGHTLEMFLRVYAKWMPEERDRGAELAKEEAAIRLAPVRDERAVAANDNSVASRRDGTG
jgi:integrase